jgi:hypothetical protein
VPSTGKSALATLHVDSPSTKQARIIPSMSLACRLSVPFRSEGTIVSVVNEDAPTQISITFDDAPTSATGIIVIVVPLPREFDQRQSIPFRIMTIDEAYDRYKLDASISIIIEGDVCRPEQIQITAAPHFHLFDAPVPGKSLVHFQDHFL